MLDPLKVVIKNYPKGKTENLEAINNPEDSTQRSRDIPFSREIYIEASDFMEEATKSFIDFLRAKEVRL